MTKTFCDVCGSEAEAFYVEATKSSVKLIVEVCIMPPGSTLIFHKRQAHVCDLCAIDLLRNAMQKVSERIAARQN